MNPSAVAIWGAVGGSAVGFLGGALGCYCSIKNTNGPRERALMIRAAVLCFLAVSLFLVGLMLTPFPYRILWWIPYPFLLMWGIRTINRKQAAIRQQEATGSA